MHGNMAIVMARDSDSCANLDYRRLVALVQAVIGDWRDTTTKGPSDFAAFGREFADTNSCYYKI